MKIQNKIVIIWGGFRRTYFPVLRQAKFYLQFIRSTEQEPSIYTPALIYSPVLPHSSISDGKNVSLYSPNYLFVFYQLFLGLGTSAETRAPKTFLEFINQSAKKPMQYYVVKVVKLLH